MVEFLRNNKFLSFVAVIFLVLGVVLGIAFGPDDIGLARKSIGGAIFGFTLGVLAIMTRYMGAYDEEPWDQEARKAQGFDEDA